MKWTSIFLLLSLTIFTTGCAKTEFVTRVEYMYPPEHLVVSEDIAVLSGNTNADLLNWVIELQSQTEQCYIRMEAIQYWMDEHRNESVFGLDRLKKSIE